MQHPHPDEAWAAFYRALDFDTKRSQLLAEGKGNLAVRASHKVEEYLDRAVALEAAAFAPAAVA